MSKYLKIDGKCPICQCLNNSLFKLCEKCRARKRVNFQKYRDSHSEEILIYVRNYKRKISLEKPWIKIFNNTKYRAKQLSLPFNLTKKYLESIWLFDGDLCPVLGIPMCTTSDQLSNLQSIDRIKPELGYIQGNVRIISHRANTLKSNANSKELLLVYQDMIKIENS